MCVLEVASLNFCIQWIQPHIPYKDLTYNKLLLHIWYEKFFWQNNSSLTIIVLYYFDLIYNFTNTMYIIKKTKNADYIFQPWLKNSQYVIHLQEYHYVRTNEYALVQHTHKPDGFHDIGPYNVGLVIAHDTQQVNFQSEMERNTLKLQYFILLMSSKDLFPKTIEDNEEKGAEGLSGCWYLF